MTSHHRQIMWFMFFALKLVQYVLIPDKSLAVSVGDTITIQQMEQHYGMAQKVLRNPHRIGLTPLTNGIKFPAKPHLIPPCPLAVTPLAPLGISRPKSIIGSLDIRTFIPKYHIICLTEGYYA